MDSRIFFLTTVDRVPLDCEYKMRGVFDLYTNVSVDIECLVVESSLFEKVVDNHLDYLLYEDEDAPGEVLGIQAVPYRHLPKDSYILITRPLCQSTNLVYTPDLNFFAEQIGFHLPPKGSKFGSDLGDLVREFFFNPSSEAIHRWLGRDQDERPLVYSKRKNIVI